MSEGLDEKVPADALRQEFTIGPLGERWMPAAYEPVSVSLDDTLVAAERESGRNRFRAVRTQVKLEDKTVYLSREAREALDVAAGARLALIPFE